MSGTVRVSSYGMLAAIFLGVAGCATAPAPLSSLACESADKAMVRDTLYFGRNRPGGGTVSDAEWRRFLDDTITPRFPDGLTVAHTTGQWRGASGKVERERSEVVTLLHAGGAGEKDKIVEIVTAYKGRFQQEAVLRERSATCARF